MLLVTFSFGVQGQVTVSSTTTWDALNPPTVGYEGGITINSGATLFVNDITLNLNPNAIIKIDKGTLQILNATFSMGENSTIELFSSTDCKFNLTNSTIESNSPSSVWNGIVIRKPTGLTHGITSQFITAPSIILPPDPNAGNCTSAEWSGVLSALISGIEVNNCEIKRAKIAIDIEGGAYYEGGGYTRIRNTIFTNNEKGIRIADWNKESYNATFIMASDFIWDDDLPSTFSTFTNLIHIELKNLQTSTVRIGGCEFINLKTDKRAFNEHGIGIKLDKSISTISKDGDKCCTAQDGGCPDNCYTNNSPNRKNKFKNLGIGIEFIGLTNIATKLAVRSSVFEDCITGIKVTTGRDVAIGNNEFTVDKANIDLLYPTGTSTSNQIFQILYSSTSGMRIYENSFTHNLENIIGIKSEQPDVSQTSFIRKNTFTYPNQVLPTCGPEIIAIELDGNNNFLDITCNTFINHVFDIKILDFASLNDIPDMSIRPLSIREFNSNTWSVLPANTSIPPPDGKWQTQGCASNVFLDNQAASVTIFDRHFGTTSGLNMKFDVNSFGKVANSPVGNTLEYPTPPCHINNTNCVDCSTNCDKLEIVKTNQSSVYGLKNSIGITIYPNPAKSEINVKLDKNYYNSNNELSIYSIDGKKIFSTTMKSQTETIDLEFLKITKGIYIVNYNNGVQNIFQKLVIN